MLFQTCVVESVSVILLYVLREIVLQGVRLAYSKRETFVRARFGIGTVGVVEPNAAEAPNSGYKFHATDLRFLCRLEIRPCHRHVSGVADTVWSAFVKALLSNWTTSSSALCTVVLFVYNDSSWFRRLSECPV